jgi:hypothetical protein
LPPPYGSTISGSALLSVDAVGSAWLIWMKRSETFVSSLALVSINSAPISSAYALAWDAGTSCECHP